MKTLLVLMLVLVAAPAFAISDSAINFCKTMKDPMECVKEFAAAEQWEAKRDAMIEIYKAEQRAIANAQAEANRAQVESFALFGSGAAMINGMNQGFNNMRVTPYNNTFQPTALPFPNAGGR